ncbi:MAG: HEAT repeat domain-containing protein [Deltaproteobacteria bacterium]|nr:HEAT repeat domain-containing protein [Deltaproteobacteria bacterium]
MKLAALNHPNAEVRRQMVVSLGDDAVATHLPELLALLGDADWRVRREVSKTIARAADVESVVAPLLAAVEAGDVALRNAAMEAIRYIGVRSADAVLDRLRRCEGSARRFLVELLADVGGEQAVTALGNLLREDDANVAHAAAEALARIEHPSALQSLLGGLDGEDPVVRLAVLQAVNARGLVLPWLRLKPLVANSILRRTAVLSAAYCVEPEALALLVQLLASGDPASAAAATSVGHWLQGENRVLAVTALRAAPQCLTILEQIAEGAISVEARRGALRCIAALGAPTSVVSLLIAMNQPETSALAESLIGGASGVWREELGGVVAQLGERATEALVQWAMRGSALGENADADRALVSLAQRQLDQGTTRGTFLELIASRGDWPAAERMIAWMSARGAHVDSGTWRATLEQVLHRFPQAVGPLEAFSPTTLLGLVARTALAATGHDVDEVALRSALANPDEELRIEAVRALGMIEGRRGVVDALVFSLGDEAPRVQAAAAACLGERGEGRDVLIASLRATDARVRRAAAVACVQWAEGIAHARTLLDDPDPSVVLAVMEGLGENLTVDELERLVRMSVADVISEALARMREVDLLRAAACSEQLLSSSEWTVRLEAVRTLGRAGQLGRAALELAKVAERDELVIEAMDEALHIQEVQ